MVVLNLKLNNILNFSDFHINFSYPKKIVGSIIEEEHLKDRPNFRYKKAIVLMGANATGKTNLGKALHSVFRFIDSGDTSPLLDLVAKNSVGRFSIDLVNEGFILHRLSATIDTNKASVSLWYASTAIGETDSYERCVKRFSDKIEAVCVGPMSLKDYIGALKYRIACPKTDTEIDTSDIDNDTLFQSIKMLVRTIDPSFSDISEAENLRDSYIIRGNNTEIIIQGGRLLNRKNLSSGVTKGIDIAIFLASVLSGRDRFYYCDEMFSCIHTDIEKRIFELILSNLKANEQLVFTTNNMDMLELNLPKHSFAFLRKKIDGEGEYKTDVCFVSEILKRNTDSIRCAVKSNVFKSLPDISLLDNLERDMGLG